MGYGFCIIDNPCDQVMLRFARPPPEIHAALRSNLPHHFKSAEWTADESGFYIRGSKHYSAGYGNPFGLACLRGVPPELVLSIQTFVSFSFEPAEPQDGLRLELWYATLDALLHRLLSKRNSIRQWDENLSLTTENKKQEFAKIYRDGQLSILCEVIEELESFLDPIEKGAQTLEEAFQGLLVSS
jgi:hypothetical protein